MRYNNKLKMDGFRFTTEYDGVISLMAVIQPKKDKVKLVLDYFELNQCASSHATSCEVGG